MCECMSVCVCVTTPIRSHINTATTVAEPLTAQVRVCKPQKRTHYSVSAAASSVVWRRVASSHSSQQQQPPRRRRGQIHFVMPPHARKYSALLAGRGAVRIFSSVNYPHLAPVRRIACDSLRCGGALQKPPTLLRRACVTHKRHSHKKKRATQMQK